MKSTLLLAGASAIALAIGAPSAQAASPTLVYGGGSTLAAKVYRDIFNCFSTAADGIFATTPATYPTGASIQYPAAENSFCTTQGKTNELTAYEPVGSGDGLAAWTTGNPVNFSSPKTSNTIAYLDNTFGIKTTPYPEIQFAASDAYLNSTQASQAATAVGEAVFQVPTFVTPIVIGIGGVQNVKLTTADVCNLFASATNKTAAGQTISYMVVRNDGSGTSFIFSDWLHQNCPANLGFTSTVNGVGNGFPSTLPNWAAVASANGNHLTIIDNAGTSGSGGEASTIVANPNSIGYVSPDYAYPVVPTNSPYPAYVNGLQPTVANVKNRLVHETYPTTYNVATVGQQINDQLVAQGGVGYPIVGYTFIDTYSCYSTTLDGKLIGNPSQGALLKQVLNLFYSSNKQVINILENQGFVETSAAVYTLMTGSGGPLNATTGIQNGSCPKT